MIWITSQNTTIFDLALQLYGDVSYSVKICNDNGLNLMDVLPQGVQINYDTAGVNTSLQQLLISNRIVVNNGNPRIIKGSAFSKAFRNIQFR